MSITAKIVEIIDIKTVSLARDYEQRMVPVFQNAVIMAQTKWQNSKGYFTLGGRFYC